MVTILMMSAKLATSGLLKIKIFRNKAYDVLILGYDVTKKFITWRKLLSRCGHVTKLPPFILNRVKKNHQIFSATQQHELL